MSPCWAPRWVGNIDDESQKLNMATPKKAKRALPESDSDSESNNHRKSSNPNQFSRFIVIKAEDSSRPITKLSPFIIEQQIKSYLGTPKAVKKLKNETLLVECASKQQSLNLLKNKKFFNLDVKIYPHETLNTCKGVIRCKELSFCDSLEEIITNLKDQGVSDVKRISVIRNNVRTDTHTYILTFSSSYLPSSIKIGFQSIKVDVYVPNPLRCFKCQRYGHHESKCNNTAVCPKCAFEGPDHDSKECKNPHKCFNCKLSHPTFSKDCSVWKDEKEILSIKHTQGISFIEARRAVEQHKKDRQQLSSNTSYAAVSAPEQNQCSTCDILLKILISKFPEVVDELKSVVPPSKLSSFIKSNVIPVQQQKKSDAKHPEPVIKPPPVKPAPPSSSSSGKADKTSAPSKPQEKSVPVQSPVKETVASSKQQSSSTKPNETLPRTNRPQLPRLPVDVDSSPSIHTSNMFSCLEALEEDMDIPSEPSTKSWSEMGENEWDKDIEAWVDSRAETKVIDDPAESNRPGSRIIKLNPNKT